MREDKEMEKKAFQHVMADGENGCIIPYFLFIFLSLFFNISSYITINMNRNNKELF